MVTVIGNELTYFVVPVWNMIANNILLSIGICLIMVNILLTIFDKIKRVLK